MLNFICGPSGSGKSAMIAEAIRHDVENGIRCYLLVPEQQAYISERDLPKKLPKNAGLYFKIVNFSGLCEDVFRKFGGSTNLMADKTSRAILMWEAIRSLSGVLKQYSTSANSNAALTECMLGAVEELQNNGIESGALEEIAKVLPQDSPLRAKLYDLSAILATYTMLLENRFGKSSPDRLVHLAKTLCKNDFFAGANFYIDSFTSFTKPEYDVLTEVIRQCASVTVGLCIDSFQKPSIHFRSVDQTAKKLVDCANRADSPAKYCFLSNENNCRPQALRVLERDLWRFDLAKENREELPDKGEDCISLLACSNIYEESEAIALNILDLVQGGMHYGDIAIFVRNLEQYQGVLDAALERRGIPCFFSERSELSTKPLARLILSALRAVSRKYRLQDIITLVKTGLCGVSERDASLFEEYCETWNISGARFLDDVWNMNPDGLETEISERAAEILETANRVRKAVILPLQTLEAELRQSKLLPDRCRAVYDYLCRIDLSAKLSDLAENELALGQVREASESLRLYDLVNDALVLLCRLLPEASVTTDELLTLLEIVFSHSDLGSVPNVHDCVLIGSAVTARAEGVRAAFLPGLCEGEFPKSIQDNGILSRSDKKVLREHGLPIESDLNNQSSEELFYVYRAVTKPLEKLYLSFPMLGSGGEIKTQSLAIRRVCFLTDRKPKDFYFSPILQNSTENTAKSDTSRLQIAPGAVGSSIYLSKSKINTFVKCPYSYYSQYVLKLRDRKKAVTTNANDGTFIHFIFEKVLAHIAKSGDFRSTMEQETLEKLVAELTLEFLSSICSISLWELDTRILHLFSRLKDMAIAMLQATLEELRNTHFKPAYFEEKIGDQIPDLSISLSDGHVVHLTGTIDRIDLCQKGDVTYIRVIDYKTGKKDFKLKDVKNGKDMQLVFYLYAAMQIDPEHFIPAAAYYLRKEDEVSLSASQSGFLLDDPELSDEKFLASQKGIQKKRKVEIEELIQTVLNKMVEISEQIFSGTAEKTPSKDACEYCIVRENCTLAVREKEYY